MALDPSGHVPGRVGIAVERYSQVAQPTGTIVALAGGPGQSAIGVLPLFRSAFAPLLATHALVVFDERGDRAVLAAALPNNRLLGHTDHGVRAPARAAGGVLFKR